MQLTTEHLNDSFYHKTANHIAEHIISKLNNAKDILGEDIVTNICANIYLNTMDKNWVEHIDDMQYLREKVGLMGYAQLDPLVIYKKESYDKYQALLDTIHTTTVIGIANIDFEQVAQHIAAQQQAQINFNIANETTNSEEDIIAKLRSASQEAPIVTKTKSHTSLTREDRVGSSSSSEFEIIDNSPSVSPILGGMAQPGGS